MGSAADVNGSLSSDLELNEAKSAQLGLGNKNGSVFKAKSSHGKVPDFRKPKNRRDK